MLEVIAYMYMTYVCVYMDICVNSRYAYLCTDSSNVLLKRSCCEIGLDWGLKCSNTTSCIHTLWFLLFKTAKMKITELILSLHNFGRNILYLHRHHILKTSTANMTKPKWLQPLNLPLTSHSTPIRHKEPIKPGVRSLSNQLWGLVSPIRCGHTPVPFTTPPGSFCSSGSRPSTGWNNYL